MSCIPAPHARRLLLATFLGAAIAPASRAGDVVIYRCTDASGALTLQNAPCPKGMMQEQRTLQGVNTVPMAPAKPLLLLSPLLLLRSHQPKQTLHLSLHHPQVKQLKPQLQLKK